MASAEFSDQIKVWQDALPPKLKGKLESVSLPPYFHFTAMLTKVMLAQRRKSAQDQRRRSSQGGGCQRRHRRKLPGSWDASEWVRVISVIVVLLSKGIGRFFASYQRADTTFNYLLGNFAQQALPLADEVTLEVVLKGEKKHEKITVSLSHLQVSPSQSSCPWNA